MLSTNNPTPPAAAAAAAATAGLGELTPEQLEDALGGILKQLEHEKQKRHLLKALVDHHAIFTQVLLLPPMAVSNRVSINTLFVRIMQHLTLAMGTHAIIMNLPNLLERLMAIFYDPETKCGAKGTTAASLAQNRNECSSGCVQNCVLRALANISCTESTQEEMTRKLMELGMFAPERWFASGSKLCKQTVQSAVALLDNLSQSLENTKLLLPAMHNNNSGSSAWLDFLMVELEQGAENNASAHKRRALLEHKQNVLSILANLARADEGGEILVYREFKIPRAMVEDVRLGTDLEENALIVLQNFARNQHCAKVFALCEEQRAEGVLDKLLAQSVNKDNSVRLRCNALKLIALFFARLEFTTPADASWMDELRLAVVLPEKDGGEVALWSLFCFEFALQQQQQQQPRQQDALFNLLPLPESVLAELVEYLRISNKEEDFPLDLVLWVVFRVVRASIGQDAQHPLEKLGLVRHLSNSLEISYANSQPIAFANALCSLELLTARTKREQLHAFSRKFVNFSDAPMFNQLLADARLGFELRAGSIVSKPISASQDTVFTDARF